MSRKEGFSKKILKILSEKSAVAIPEIIEKINYPKRGLGLDKYPISRSIKGLESSGLIEQKFSGQHAYARLTQEGKKKMHSIHLDHDTTLVNPSWDGKWRVAILDLPENRKDEREALRYLLKKAGFVCLKNSVWISPFPYEYLFANIKKDFNLTTELMIFVTDKVDKETEKTFFELMKK